MIKRLSGDYNRGYTKAIMDVTKVFEYVARDLSYHKMRFTNKLALRLFQVILENREAIREQRDGFIRWNTRKKDLEYFTREKVTT